MQQIRARQICAAILQFAPEHMARIGDVGEVKLRELSLTDILYAVNLVKAEALRDFHDHVAIPNDLLVASVYALLHTPTTQSVIAVVPCPCHHDYKTLTIERIPA